MTHSPLSPPPFRSVLAFACAASVGLFSVPGHAATRSTKTRTSPTVARAPTTGSTTPDATATTRGRDFFSAIFFDSGPYAGKLKEFHEGRREAYKVNRSAKVSRTPEQLRELAVYLERRGDDEGAAAALSAASLTANASSSNVYPAEARRLLLAAIEYEDPTFFARFAKAVDSANPAEIDRAITEAGYATVAALEVLQEDGVSVHELDIGGGPAHGFVAIALVIVLVVAVVYVAIDKDTPDYDDGEGDGCGGGGDCESMTIPDSVLERAELAKLIATRLARV